MIKFEHVVTASPEQMEFIIEGMRNPMNSWAKSDSALDSYDGVHADNIFIGQNDFSLMKNLAKAGTDHRKFMRMMPVMVRITAPLYWWKEFDTYKVGTVANSCSTMHKITEKKFYISDFSTEHLMEESISVLEDTIETLNEVRDLYLGFDGFKEKYYGKPVIIPDKKELWWQMIQLLPSSYNQTRNVVLNYEVLANIYKSRRNHKLDEWRAFCLWAQELPYAELIMVEE